MTSQTSRLLLVIFTTIFVTTSSAFSRKVSSPSCRCAIEGGSMNRGVGISKSKLDTSQSKHVTEGPPLTSKPNYSSIHGPLGPWVDRFLMGQFRMKLSSRLNRKSSFQIPDSVLPRDDFMGIIEITSAMNTKFNSRTQVQSIAQDVLISLFPSFILKRYPVWFAAPFPEFSAKMCAWATVLGGTWLMGECHVNDIPGMKDGGKRQGVLVKRCRFLEESQCASICVNACKIPTQNFFRENMGLPLTITPDYDTGECQFAYGKSPTEEEDSMARNTPCLMRCPTAGGMKAWHGSHESERNGNDDQGNWMNDLKMLSKLESKERDKSCTLMDD